VATTQSHRGAYLSIVIARRPQADAAIYAEVPLATSRWIATPLRGSRWRRGGYWSSSRAKRRVSWAARPGLQILRSSQDDQVKRAPVKVKEVERIHASDRRSLREADWM